MPAILVSGETMVQYSTIERYSRYVVYILEPNISQNYSGLADLLLHWWRIYCFFSSPMRLTDRIKYV